MSSAGYMLILISFCLDVLTIWERIIRKVSKSLLMYRTNFMYHKPIRNYGRYDLQMDSEKRETVSKGSYITTRSSLWDIATGALFVEEAGGDILHFDASPYRW